MSTMSQFLLQDAKGPQSPHCHEACSVISRWTDKVLKWWKKISQLLLVAELQKI